MPAGGRAALGATTHLTMMLTVGRVVVLGDTLTIRSSLAGITALISRKVFVGPQVKPVRTFSNFQTRTPQRSSLKLWPETPSQRTCNGVKGYAKVEATNHEGSRHTTGENFRGTSVGKRQELSSLTNMVTYLESHRTKVIEHRGIPSEAEVNAALHACQVVADYLMDETVQPRVIQMLKTELETTASGLLSLDANSDGTQRPMSSPVHRSRAGGTVSNEHSVAFQLQGLIEKISNTAYEIIAHPTVIILQSVLRQYINVQARLGKPESLPHIFDLYVTKPRPYEKTAGSVDYKPRNQIWVYHKFEPDVVEMALDVAIKTKNLDAAVGIIESTYATPAFIRAKMLRKLPLPIGTYALVPGAAYVLARKWAEWQFNLDVDYATSIAFWGFMAYVFFTSTIGFVALTTANDQMRRVTWAPGIGLHTRWLQEEKRAAIDKVACAWGFSEEHRHGQETGFEWEVLREYVGQRAMILDRVDLSREINT